MAIYKYLARKDGFALPSIHTCRRFISKLEINKANNSVKQVLDTASQNKFMAREKYNVEEQEIGKCVDKSSTTKTATIVSSPDSHGMRGLE